MKIYGVIPARYSSSRLPGKVLLDIGGKSLVQRVYEQAIKVRGFEKVIIAVDDTRVADHVKNFGADWVMTHVDHNSGTDRCAEAVKSFKDCTHVINIQGDEPFIHTDVMEGIIELFKSKESNIVSMMTPILNKVDFHNPNVVKVVVDQNSDGLYFSRAAIPYQRENNIHAFTMNNFSFKHIGIYGFEVNTLNAITALPIGNLEQIEKLEQLRWLENGYKIRMGVTTHQGFGVDTEEDLQRARDLVKS